MPLDPPLDEELPLDDELLDEEELLDELEEVDEPPVEEVDVELTPPVEVLVEPPLVEVDPPLVELPPVEVELPPVDVELPPVLVDPPLVEVEPPVLVEETTTLPPLEPPPKKPPKNPPMPPPQPPLPPATMIGPELPPDMAGISRLSGTGAPWVCTVTTVGAALVTVLTVRTTLRVAFTGWRFTSLVAGAMGLRFICFTTVGREASASWSAPPPMMAPPHAQAQSFAKAIRTDMIAHSSEL